MICSLFFMYGGTSLKPTLTTFDLMNFIVRIRCLMI